MDSILNTIRKLLTLANDASATEGETQAALGRVAALAARHNVSDVEIEKAYRADGSAGAKISVSVDDLVDEVLHGAKSLTRWDKWIAQAATTATSTGVYTSWKGGLRVLRIYGLPQDVAVARELFAFARSALSKQTRRWCKDHGTQASGAQGRTYKDGWTTGLGDAATAEAVRRNTDGADKVAIETAEEGTTALVLVSDVSKAKQTALVAKADCLNLGKGRRTGARTWGGSDAYGAGKAAGRATNLSRGAIR